MCLLRESVFMSQKGGGGYEGVREEGIRREGRGWGAIGERRG